MFFSWSIHDDCEAICSCWLDDECVELATLREIYRVSVNMRPSSFWEIIVKNNYGRYFTGTIEEAKRATEEFIRSISH